MSMNAIDLVILMKILEKKTEEDCDYLDEGFVSLYTDAIIHRFEDQWKKMSSKEQMGQILKRRGEHLMEEAGKMLRRWCMDKKGIGAV